MAFDDYDKVFVSAWVIAVLEAIRKQGAKIYHKILEDIYDDGPVVRELHTKIK